jgi:hypothetical protein
MQKITEECKQEGITICDHVTSHMRILASDIKNERIIAPKINVPTCGKWFG